MNNLSAFFVQHRNAGTKDMCNPNKTNQVLDVVQKQRSSIEPTKRITDREMTLFNLDQSRLVNVLHIQTNKENSQITNKPFGILFQHPLLKKENVPEVASLVFDVVHDPSGSYLMSLETENMKFEFVGSTWRLMVPGLTTPAQFPSASRGSLKDPEGWKQSQLFLDIEFNDGTTHFAFCGVVLSTSEESLVVSNELQASLMQFKTSCQAEELEDEPNSYESDVESEEEMETEDSYDLESEDESYSLPSLSEVKMENCTPSNLCSSMHLDPQLPLSLGEKDSLF